MLATVSFRLPGGEVVVAGPGALIGRAFTAEVRLDTGRVSEAHALVSLRGGELLALALRGRMRVEGRDVTRVPLRPGLALELAPGTVLEVESVALPDTVLAVEGPGVPRQILVETTSVVSSPGLHLVRGATEHAEALIWSDGLRWRARVGDGPVRTL
jgi:hypothetical protein